MFEFLVGNPLKFLLMTKVPPHYLVSTPKTLHLQFYHSRHQPILLTTSRHHWWLPFVGFIENHSSAAATTNDRDLWLATIDWDRGSMVGYLVKKCSNGWYMDGNCLSTPSSPFFISSFFFASIYCLKLTYFPSIFFNTLFFSFFHSPISKTTLFNQGI